MKVVYFIPDFSDPAVVRRVEMLIAGGGDVVPIGFRRDVKPVASIAGIPAIDLGETKDADLGRRTWLVAKHVLGAGRFKSLLNGADVVMARNLDMLAIAAAARRAGAPNAKLVYECLDIHASMVKPGPRSLMLRKLEGALLRACSLLATSSPGFIEHYFAVHHRQLPRTLLLENKVLRSAETVLERPNTVRTPGPPWRIGWFGKQRCRKSLECLKEIARLGGDQVEIVIRGRPAAHIFPDLAGEIADLPNMSFLGPYTYNDLVEIYADVHFMWGIEYFDEGANSDWLLPNRVYEGVYGNAPIIADRKTETATWLAAHQAGLLVTDPISDVIACLRELDGAAYARLEERSHAIDTKAVACDRDECRQVVAALAA